MKPILTFAIAAFVVSIFSVACSDPGPGPDPEPVPPVQPAGALKQITQVEFLGYPADKIVSMYEYDSQGRLAREIVPAPDPDDTPNAVYYYFYDSRGRLERIEYFPDNVNTGPTHLYSTNFFYDSHGRKLLQTRTYPTTGSTIWEYTEFTWENDLLVIENYFDGDHTITTAYEYNEAKELIRETKDYHPSQMLTLHTWENGLNTVSDYYRDDGTHMYQIRRQFDDQGRITFLEQQVLWLLSSLADYTHRYDYY